MDRDSFRPFTKDKVTAPDLAEMFEVSRRTISRDIEALCITGIPIVTTQGVNGGIQIMDGYRADRTVLTSKEMRAIIAGLRSLDSISGTNRYAQLMEKLSAGTSTVLPAGQNILINLAAWDKVYVSERIERVYGAIERKRKLRLHYSVPSGESDRQIEPYYLVFEWASWYVWGWCDNREDFRLFKIGGMTDIEIAESFEERTVPYPDLSTEQVFPHRYQVKAIIQPELRWRILEEYGEDSFATQKDGTLLFSFGFTDMNSIRSWALSFGAGIEPLEPPEIREELRSFGMKLSQKYSNP